MRVFRILDSQLFRADSLSWVMAGLILFVFLNVTAYSSRYLAGDRNRRSHQYFTLLLGACALCMAIADHLLILLVAWVSSNLLLVRLMMHKAQWIAARNSGLLALRTFSVGFILLGAGFWLLAANAGTASISSIVQTQNTSTTSFAGLILVAMAAMTQSAAWPFHRWLISSLNSPTPVSALMHAGIVNGGGFLLVRFAPLYAREPVLLHCLFVAGLITAIVGTFWKLIQTDVKRMLACSTMGQMGFMLMQCGLGLFAPAVSHLCWHGLFKAYLFLNAGSVVHEKRSLPPSQTQSVLRLMLSGLAGTFGALMFALTSGTNIGIADTSCLMIMLAFMAAAQLSLGLLSTRLSLSRLTLALLAGTGAGALYGISIRIIETTLTSLHAMQPQPMDALYFLGIALIFLAWLSMILNPPDRTRSSAAWKRIYMAGLNASQPHSNTVTATRTAYKS